MCELLFGIFYRVKDKDERVEVILIGEKQDNKLLIGGEGFML